MGGETVPIETLLPKDQAVEKEVEEKVRNEQASTGREFQSGHLNSHFHRNDNETLRLLLGFLDSGSAKKVEKAGVKQK